MYRGTTDFCSFDTSYCGSCYRPQNKYLCMLIDEFEKCSQQSSSISSLKKEVVAMKNDLTAAQRQIRDLQFENKMLSDKLTVTCKSLNDYKMLHSQLRDESTSEFRSAYKRMNTVEKDIDLLKYRSEMSTKKVGTSAQRLCEMLATQTGDNTSLMYQAASDS